MSGECSFGKRILDGIFLSYLATYNQASTEALRLGEQRRKALEAKAAEDANRAAALLKVGLYKLNSIDPSFESAWFQRLNL
jgi:hypothetical protein